MLPILCPPTFRAVHRDPTDYPLHLKHQTSFIHFLGYIRMYALTCTYTHIHIHISSRTYQHKLTATTYLLICSLGLIRGSSDDDWSIALWESHKYIMLATWHAYLGTSLDTYIGYLGTIRGLESTKTEEVGGYLSRWREGIPESPRPNLVILNHLRCRAIHRAID